MSDAGANEPGWRIDPADPTMYRYFDGSAWTTHTAPVAPYAGQPYAGAVGPPKTLSVVSMVVSLSSILVFVVLSVVGLLAAVAGLVLGIIASRREPHARPFWLTGIIVGGAVALLGLVGAVLLFSLFATTVFA